MTRDYICKCAQCCGTAEPEEETCADGRCGECASCIAEHSEADRGDWEYERRRDREMEREWERMEKEKEGK